MENESGLTRSITDELHSWDIQRDQMEGKIGLTRSIIDELNSSDIQRDQMEGESSVTRTMIDEIHSSDFQGYQNGKRKWCYSKYHLRTSFFGYPRRSKET